MRPGGGGLLPPRLQERAGSAPTGALLALLYGLAVLPAALTFHRAGHFGVETDFFLNYAPAADRIVEWFRGREVPVHLDGYRGPLYPFALAAAGVPAGNTFTAGVALSGIAAAGVLFLTHRIAAAVFGGPPAFLCVAILATNAVSIQYSYTAGTDMFFNLLATLAVHAAVRALRAAGGVPETGPKAAAWAAAAGLASALAALTRQNGLSLAAAFFVAVLAVDPAREGIRGRLVKAAAFAGAFLAAAAPILELSRRLTGACPYGKNHLNVAKALLFPNLDWDTFRSVTSKRFSSLADVVLSDPAGCAAGLLRNVPSHLAADLTTLLYWPLGLLAVLGIAAAAVFRRLDRLQAAYAVFALTSFAALLPAPHRARYSLGLLAPYALAAVGFHEWWGKGGAPGGRRARAGIVWAVVAITSLSGLQEARLALRREAREVLVVRDKLAAPRGGPPLRASEESVCARKPHVAYHLRMRWARISPRDDSYEETLRECRRQGAAYLYYGRVEERGRPGLRRLLDPNSDHPGLEPVVHTVDPRAVLYRILPDG
jgi:hypothetical protein